MKSLVIGASSGLGRALAEELARSGHDLLLMSSDKRDLEPLASDLSLRFRTQVHALAASLVSIPGHTIRDVVMEKLQSVDCIFCVAGLSLLDRDFEFLKEEEIEELIQVNFSSAIRILIALLPTVARSQQANLIGVGSIAATRARNRNTVYAASKRALEFFFDGLFHHFRGTSVKIQFYRVGFLDTSMTFGQSLLLPKANPVAVAREMIGNLGKNVRLAYLPWWWRWVMCLYSVIPSKFR